MRQKRPYYEKDKKMVESADRLISSIIPAKTWKVYLPRRVIWQKWHEIVGTSVSEACYPWYFQDLDCLVVAVSDSIWMQQLSYQSAIILEKINALLPQTSRLSRLRFVIADTDAVRRELSRYFKKSRKRKSEPSVLVEPSRDELWLLDGIDDKELKKRFMNLLLHLRT